MVKEHLENWGTENWEVEFKGIFWKSKTLPPPQQLNDIKRFISQLLQRREIKLLRDKGFTYEQIAKTWGVQREMVSQVVERYFPDLKKVKLKKHEK